MLVDDQTRLALLTNIGEPLEATNPDSLFNQEQVDGWIKIASSIEQASLFGWRAKMAAYANLVSVSDGAASRSFSDLFDNARQMVTMYNRLAVGPTAGRSRVGKITRP